MRPIGGHRSTLFAVSANEASAILEAVQAGHLNEMLKFRDELAGGGLVEFRSMADAESAQALLA